MSYVVRGSIGSECLTCCRDWVEFRPCQGETPFELATKRDQRKVMAVLCPVAWPAIGIGRRVFLKWRRFSTYVGRHHAISQCTRVIFVHLCAFPRFMYVCPVDEVCPAAWLTGVPLKVLSFLPGTVTYCRSNTMAAILHCLPR